MQGVLNEAEFNNPRRLQRWLLRAGGWRNANAKQEGGIWNPKPVKLRRGLVLYRVGHSTGELGAVPDEANLSRPWWLEGETFQEIAISSNVVGIDRHTMARLKLSVSPRYGVFDTVFCVRLRDTVGALRGEGNVVFDPPDSGHTGAPTIWAWSPSGVMQCFVPGLQDFHDRPTGLAQKLFELLAKFPVSAWQMIDK